MEKKYPFLKFLILIAVYAAVGLLIPEMGCAAFKPGERAMKIWYQDLNPSKHAIFLKFKTAMDTGGGKEKNVTTMAIKGKYAYADVFSDSEHISTITDTAAKSTVILLHEDKMYMKMPNASNEGPKINEGRDISEAEKTKMVLSSGKEKIAGKTYDYDKIKVDGEDSHTYYFEEDTDKWKYWRTSDALMEIIEYGTKVDEALFNIPKGYSEMKL